MYPREPTERDELGMAVGKAIDEALSRFSHQSAAGGRVGVAQVVRGAQETLGRELEDAHLTLPSGEEERLLATLRELVRLFRQSELFGLRRPRTRLLLIDGVAGVYAQPDFWNGRDRIYELKSYRASPPRPDVQLQLDLFQLAFPGFDELLVSLDRHAVPPTLELVRVPPLGSVRAGELLRTARDLALRDGQEKVVDYIDCPIVRRSTVAHAQGRP